jgi:hypothetical protein
MWFHYFLLLVAKKDSCSIVYFHLLTIVVNSTTRGQEEPEPWVIYYVWPATEPIWLSDESVNYSVVFFSHNKTVNNAFNQVCLRINQLTSNNHKEILFVCLDKHVCRPQYPAIPKKEYEQFNICYSINFNSNHYRDNKCS